MKPNVTVIMPRASFTRSVTCKVQVSVVESNQVCFYSTTVQKYTFEVLVLHSLQHFVLTWTFFTNQMKQQICDMFKDCRNLNLICSLNSIIISDKQEVAVIGSYSFCETVLQTVVIASWVFSTSVKRTDIQPVSIVASFLFYFPLMQFL